MPHIRSMHTEYICSPIGLMYPVRVELALDKH
uniref:Uncharacterized protein n=1 Tax=Anguilla anguilla TaxID=7936 RepID=A0A0E9U5R8_ANGAN